VCFFVGVGFKMGAIVVQEGNPTSDSILPGLGSRRGEMCVFFRMCFFFILGTIQLSAKGFPSCEIMAPSFV
jgi:hypothetical protein